MTWSVDRIEQEWLGGPSSLAFRNDVLVELFDVVESRFGPEWMASQRDAPSTTGALPTLQIAIAGELIRGSAGLPGSDHLLARLRAGEPGIKAEMLALAAIRRSNPSIAIDLEPAVKVGAGIRAPDLGLSLEGTSIFVEVSSPQRSKQFQDLSRTVDELATRALHATPFGNSSEIYFHEAPSENDIVSLLAAIDRLCVQGGEQLERGDVASIVVNHSPPTIILPFEHGDEHRPRLGGARVEADGDRARHALVRYPFTDQRAAKILRTEARQLPVGAPGIVILHVGGSALTAWDGLLRARLHPAQHTRVSAIVLLQSGIVSLRAGEAWAHQAIVIENEHATHRAPEWALAPFHAWADGEFHSLP